MATLPAYPDVITNVRGHIPFRWDYDMLVLKSSFADGSESRRALWNAPRRNISIKYTLRSLDDMQTIFEYYRKKEGSLISFAFFHPQRLSYNKEFCGTYEGTGSPINLPSKGATSVTMYVNNVSVPFSIDTGGHGPYGEDQAVITGGLNQGDKVSMSFTGRLKTRARFADGAIQVDEVKDQYASFTVNLVGLQARLI